MQEKRKEGERERNTRRKKKRKKWGCWEGETEEGKQV